MHVHPEAPLAPAQYLAKPRLYRMRAGQMFRVHHLYPSAPGDDMPRAARLGVLALLTHAGEPISDSTRIWCVVIGANVGDGTPGEFFGLPRDTVVERLHLAAPINLAGEH